MDIRSYPDLTTTKDGQPYYRGKTKSGSELFCSKTQLQIAGSCESIFIDGTFGTCPFPFYQVVYINGRCGENVYPLATALLPNKLQDTYKEVFELFLAVCQENGHDLDAIYVHCDCEMAIINAVRAVFPSTQLRLCRFHVVDAIRRHANSLGLRGVINRRPDFKRFYNRVRQIFFFPIHLWPRLLKTIDAQLEANTKAIPAVQQFIDYLVSIEL